nr:reverse transcriptase domain-containing protein [Tanacetum cinerariifolium]
CKEKDRVKFAMATLRGRALTWWNGRTKAMGIEATNNTHWSEMKGMDIDGYTNRFHELALLCPRMVEPEAVKGEKRKGESDRGGHDDNQREHNRRQNQRRGNAGAMTNAAPNNNKTCQKCKNKRHAGDCWKCTKCSKLGYKAERCRISKMNCYNCQEKGHRKRDCPKLELGSFDVIIGMDWLSKKDAAILCGKKKVRIPLKNKALIIEGDKNQSRLKIISCIKARKYIDNGCELFLAQVTGTVSKEKRVEDVPIICDFPEVFPEDLPGLPPPRQVEFRIDLIPGATPVARAPYRLAPFELKELFEQLKELSEK